MLAVEVGTQRSFWGLGQTGLNARHTGLWGVTVRRGVLRIGGLRRGHAVIMQRSRVRTRRAWSVRDQRMRWGSTVQWASCRLQLL